MSYASDQMPLACPTPLTWVDAVLSDFPRFLQDHAACERKASANAMSMVSKFPDQEALLEPMICLAKEELIHFHEMFRLLQKKGLTLGVDEKDPYVSQMLKAVRHGRREHFLDRLLVAGLIEARGCERFALLAEHLVDGEMKVFYERLAREEGGHFRVFLRLARHFYSDEEVEPRLAELIEIEAQAMLAVPPRPAVH